MKANPSKFQAISFGKRGTNITNFTFENTTIHCENSVVLLGIETDHQCGDRLVEIIIQGSGDDRVTEIIARESGDGGWKT